LVPASGAGVNSLVLGVISQVLHTDTEPWQMLTAWNDVSTNFFREFEVPKSGTQVNLLDKKVHLRLIKNKDNLYPAYIKKTF
jgi:hypothetical protein